MRGKDIIKFNYDNMKKIDPKYDELVTNVVSYIRGELAEIDSEEAINDILEIFLGAQERGEDLYEVVGDYKEFCNNVIECYKENEKFYFMKNIKDLLKVWAAMVGFFIALDAVFSVGRVKDISIDKLIESSYKLTPTPIIASVIAVIIAYGIVRYILKSDNMKSKKIEALSFFIIYILFTIIMAAIGLAFRNSVLLKIPNYLVVMIVAILVLGVYIFIGIRQGKGTKAC